MYPRIDIERQSMKGEWAYIGSTTNFASLEEARAAYLDNAHDDPNRIRARFTSEARPNRKPDFVGTYEQFLAQYNAASQTASAC